MVAMRRRSRPYRGSRSIVTAWAAGLGGLGALAVDDCCRRAGVAPDPFAICHVRTASGEYPRPRWWRTASAISASLIGHLGSSTFRLSTACSVDVAHGLVLLFGIGTKALPSWDSRTRWNNLLRRPCRQTERQVQADMRTHLIHRPARDIIPPLGGARVSSYRI